MKKQTQKRLKKKKHGLVSGVNITKETISAPSQPVEPEPEVDPIEKFHRWIDKYCVLNSDSCHVRERDKEYAQKVVSDVDINEVIKKLSLFGHNVIDELLEAAYGGKNWIVNPLEVVRAIEYDGGDIFDKYFTEYIESRCPEYWSIPLLELIAHSNCSYGFYEGCEWRRDKEKARDKFKDFAKGQVSPTQHSQELYHFIMDLFFGYSTVVHQESTSQIISYLAEASFYDREAYPRLMQAMIEMAKKNVFLWDFENYMTYSP